MQLQSSENIEILSNTLFNIRTSILLLQEWNKGVVSSDEWVDSSSGMQKLAANCMLIEAIGEAVKKIEKRAGMDFLNLQPQIPWLEVMSMRNHIAHGYFDLDDAFVLSVIQNDLEPLLNAVDYLMKELEVQRTGLEVDASLDTK
ncbi:MAG: DUF86 domain-containing protein [Paludibacteraceae bacterium]|nr:DUF86 domain-containing protein [Paludibacteraceae bacterium]